MDATSFQSKIKTRWFLTIFVMVWTLGCVAMLGLLIYACVQQPSRADDLIAIWLVFPIAAILSSNYVIWQLKGQEHFVVCDAHIELFNSGTIFRRRLKLTFVEFERLEFNQQTQSQLLTQFWGFGGGQIEIHYLGRMRRFGKDLPEVSAKEMYNQIQKAIESRTSNKSNDHTAN